MLLTTPQLLAEITDGVGVSFPQAARLLPPGRGGRPVHPSCLWRWATEGARGPDGQRIRLEAARLGARTLTSKTALSRFAAALSGQVVETAPTLRTPAARTRGHQAAVDALSKIGI